MAATGQRVVARRRSEKFRDGGPRIPEMQRSRLLVAAIATIDELGYEGASVAQITGRARISRRTFYDIFDNREQCLAEIVESAFERIGAEIAAADLKGKPWSERVRGGLATILGFFDREPALARVCILQTQRASRRVLERRQEIMDILVGVVDEGRASYGRVDVSSELTAQIVVGGAFSVVYARLLDRDRGSLLDLLGELMAIVVLPYAGSQVARRERARTIERPPKLELAASQGEQVMPESFDQLARIPMRLTYRTARVLRDVGDHPGSSNRQVAQRVEIADQGQVSKLLARLQRLGLLANATDGGPARGEANEWHLTQTGEQIVITIRAHEQESRTSSNPSSKTAATRRASRTIPASRGARPRRPDGE
jgi:AcrR family transcriptional regulator